jgi:hypothetical protein
MCHQNAPNALPRSTVHTTACFKTRLRSVAIGRPYRRETPGSLTASASFVEQPGSNLVELYAFAADYTTKGRLLVHAK